MRVSHLARRFFGSLSSSPPDPRHEAWLRERLGPGELELLDRLSVADRRHAVSVARCVAHRLGAEATDDVLAAAALHDVGKVVSGFGTLARVPATVAWMILPSSWAEPLSHRSGLLGRLGAYHCHPDIGAELLATAGSADLTCAWAAEHHLGEPHWTLDVEIGRILKHCDDD